PPNRPLFPYTTLFRSAYNDFAHEYASYAPKRLIPIASISMTDVDAAIKEAQRCARLGFRGVFISNDPAPERRYSDPMWEPFWSADRKSTRLNSSHSQI